MKYIILLSLLLMSIPIAAQEKSSREKKLEDTVKLLEERIKRLENLLLKNPDVVKSNNDENSKEDINKRLAKIEKFMATENSPKNIDVYWKNGLKFKSKDEKVNDILNIRSRN